MEGNVRIHIGFPRVMIRTSVNAIAEGEGNISFTAGPF
jgi:hypothetical protein